MEIKLSASDRKLLTALQKNAGLSQIDLAESSGLSRTSVWRRVRELEDAGVIEGRVALLNPKAIGLQIHVLLSVSMVEHSDRIRKAFETHVEEILLTKGGWKVEEIEEEDSSDETHERPLRFF